MRKVVVMTNLTLDGVMQSPARPDEDPRDGFPYGGWGVPYAAMNMVPREPSSEPGTLLIGRRTYEDFYGYWPKQKDSPFMDLLNNMTKYVASTTLKEPLPWMNSILLKGDVGQAVADLKAQPGKDFLVMGSGELVQTLRRHHLVDTYILLIHPLVLGTGRKLFPEGTAYEQLQLMDSKAAPNGVVMLTYQPVQK